MGANLPAQSRPLEHRAHRPLDLGQRDIDSRAREVLEHLLENMS